MWVFGRHDGLELGRGHVALLGQLPIRAEGVDIFGPVVEVAPLEQGLIGARVVLLIIVEVQDGAELLEETVIFVLLAFLGVGRAGVSRVGRHLVRAQKGRPLRVCGKAGSS